MDTQLQELLKLTNTLGEPDRHLSIIGEGNTSTKIDDDSFWIKASGQQMETMTADGFVAIKFAPILELLNTPDLPSDEIKRISNDARVDTNVSVVPSVEVTFHAALLSDCNVDYVAHTHPVAVNQILCSPRAEQFANHRTFPDEVVLCGPRSVFVPYVDPGLPLAIEIRRRVREYMDAEGEAPKVILLKSHGLITLGQTATEALNVTRMAVKAASIFVGACICGGPEFMSEADINHIYKRPDEIYRRKQFVENSN